MIGAAAYCGRVDGPHEQHGQHGQHGEERPPQAVEDYVKAIYGIEERAAAVTTGALAAELQVTPSSVSAMLARLRNLGLITHQPYAEASLSESGRRLALRVIRRRRLIESFLVEALDYRWDEVEQEAARLGRAASDLFIGRIADKLGHPAADPHGDPIPGPEDAVLAAPGHLLASLEPGAAGRLVRVWNGDPEVLRYLDSREIKLGDQVEVLSREPFGGPMIVRVGEPKEGRVHALGLGLAGVLSIECEP